MRWDLTERQHNVNVVSSIPEFETEGRLPAGIQKASWEDFAVRYGNNAWRRLLLEGLREAIINLKQAGCRTVYIDGSFVTNKEIPGDFDACWEETGVDPLKLEPTLLEFANGRAAQKAKYFGELIPASSAADTNGFSFLDFFQTDTDNGRRKGILSIDLRE